MGCCPCGFEARQPQFAIIRANDEKADGEFMDIEVKKRFRSLVLSDEDWIVVPSAKPAKGESGGCFVTGAKSMIGGFLKPGKKNPGWHRAAAEKIASDLAFDSDINVPPTVLHNRTNALPNQEHYVAVSLCPSGGCLEWTDLLVPNPSKAQQQLLRYVLKSASGIIALDALLDNDDRPTLGNTIFACDEEPPHFFLDFSNGMNRNGKWTNERYQTFAKPPPLPQIFLDSLSVDITRGAASRIAAISDATVEEIVQRIPDDFLPPDERTNLAKWLIWRKNHLCSSFEKWYPGKNLNA